MPPTIPNLQSGYTVIMKNPFYTTLATMSIIGSFLLINTEALAIYDPERQQHCDSSSTDMICLSRSFNPGPDDRSVQNFVPLIRIILSADLGADLKRQLLQLIIQNTAIDPVDVGNETTHYSYNGGHATFQDGRYSFNLGCNTIAGSYTQTGSSIEFSQSIQTKMGCEESLMQKDSQLVSDLQTINTIRFDGRDVLLLNGDVIVIRLEK